MLGVCGIYMDVATNLVAVGSCDEDDWPLCWDIVRSSGPNLSEEYRGHDSPEQEHTVVDEAGA